MLLHVILSVERLVTPRAVDGARVDMLSSDMTNQHTFAAERAAVGAVYPVTFKRAVVIPDKHFVNASFQCEGSCLTLVCWLVDREYAFPGLSACRCPWMRMVVPRRRESPKMGPERCFRLYGDSL